jgi:hypothetical protein
MIGIFKVMIFLSQKSTRGGKGDIEVGKGDTYLERVQNGRRE